MTIHFAEVFYMDVVTAKVEGLQFGWYWRPYRTKGERVGPFVSKRAAQADADFSQRCEILVEDSEAMP